MSAPPPLPPAAGPQPAPTWQGIDLGNCDREPIHVPGLIQPHGHLLAFDLRGQLRAWSAASAAVTGLADPRALQLDQWAIPAELQMLIRSVLAEAISSTDGSSSGAQSLQVVVAGQQWDAVVHAHLRRLIVEFEPAIGESDDRLRYALEAHRVIDRIKRQRQLEPLLQTVVEQVQAMTGFDRVMAYRFRHDDSGQVVAEARVPSLAPFLGMRYPASDIPAQARRLYVLNTLRLIADVAYTPVSLWTQADEPLLDMSHCTLRSVSPIHVEYLRNMGVHASMSVSIVVDGRLWGLLACHHQSPLRIPYPVRMACDVMAQVLAATVQGMEAARRAQAVQQAAQLRERVAQSLGRHEDWPSALQNDLPALRQVLGADALVLRHGDQVTTDGDITAAHAQQVLASLPPAPDDLLVRLDRADWPGAQAEGIGPWVGLLGLGIEPGQRDWLLALRREQVENIRWGGKPEKIVQTGPLGQRLTPRGSFEEWHQTVRDLAEPWDADQLQAGRLLQAELRRAELKRHADLDRARTQMLALVSHDLRDPLHSITMAARLLEHSPPRQDGTQQRMGARIRASTTRMQRLVGELLDFSRLRHGLGLGIQRQRIDLHALVLDLCDESRQSHPDVPLTLESAEPVCEAEVDPDRLAQALGNLIGNARHHGDLGGEVMVRLQSNGEWLHVEVRNRGQAIPEAAVAQLFTPFKESSAQAGGRHRGLGLGLYIAHAIAQAHGGSLGYRHEAPDVVFTLSLPRHAPKPGSEQLPTTAPNP